MSIARPQLTHITRKNGVYYWRRRLPGLRHGEVSLSLRTRRFREAEHRAAILDATLRDVGARGGVSSDRDVQAALRAYLRHTLEALDQPATEPVLIGAGAPDGHPAGPDVVAARAHRRRAAWAASQQDVASTALTALGIVEEHDLPSALHRKVALGVLEANLRVAEEALRRARGEAPSLTAESDVEPFTLSDASEAAPAPPLEQPPPVPEVQSTSPSPATVPPEAARRAAEAPSRPLASSLVEPYFARRETIDRSNGDAVVGVAMAAPVLRNDAVKTHLVFWAPVILGLLSDDPDTLRLALAIVAHECGHAAEHAQRDRVLPNVILRHRFEAFADSFLFQPAEVIWEEYAASRHAAAFSNGETEAGYREGLSGVLRRARPEANDAIKAYRLHGDVNRLLAEAGAPIAEPLRLVAYLAGHLDGQGRDALNELRSCVEFDDRLAPRTLEAVGAARALWETRDRWAGLAVFDGLKVVVRSALADHGIHLHPRPDGQAYVDVPFTPETVPD